jgi:hypothetical protein
VPGSNGMRKKSADAWPERAPAPGRHAPAGIAHTVTTLRDWRCVALSHLCFISSNLAGCSLARIVEEELIAVEIIDHQKPVAP